MRPVATITVILFSFVSLAQLVRFVLGENRSKRKIPGTPYLIHERAEGGCYCLVMGRLAGIVAPDRYYGINVLKGRFPKLAVPEISFPTILCEFSDAP